MLENKTFNSNQKYFHASIYRVSALMQATQHSNYAILNICCWESRKIWLYKFTALFLPIVGPLAACGLMFVIIMSRRSCLMNSVLGDFGSAQRVSHDGIDAIQSSTYTKDTLGTVAYKAPELLRGCLPSSSADIYAFGILSWQMMSRRHPYNNQVRILCRPPLIPLSLDLSDCLYCLLFSTIISSVLSFLFYHLFLIPNLFS